MVDTGCTARAAYDQVPALHARGESCIQNINKRGKQALKNLEEELPPSTQKKQPKPKPKKLKPKKKSLLPKGKRLRPDQVDALMVEKIAKRQNRSDAHKKATSELAKLREGGEKAAKGARAEIVSRINEEFGLTGTEALTPRGISQAVAKDKAGESPDQPGPKSSVPKALTKSLGIRAQLLQLSGQEQGSRKLLASAMASIKGTDLESLLDSKDKRMRMVRAIKAACPELRTKQKKGAEDRRAEWLCRSRLLRWFLGYVRQLKDLGFIEPKPDNALFIPPWKLRRMGNSDEKHHKLSNEGATSGSRANVLINPTLARCGNRVIASSRHITGWHWVNYEGEVGAPHMIFDSSAATEEERKISLAWVVGLPHPKGFFGFEEETTLVPSFSVTPKGGTVGGSLEDFATQQLYKAYPNISPEWEIDYNVPAGCEPIVVKGPVFHQLDGGPDRLGQASLKFRIAAKAKGLCLFPGLQNGTAANQVMDDLFGPFQLAMDEVMDDIVTERQVAAVEAEETAAAAAPAAALPPKKRRKQAQLAAEDDAVEALDYSTGEVATAKAGKVVVSLSNNDLPRVMNGRPGDPIKKRAFSRHFTKSKIVASVKKLGLYPIDAEQACSHPKVRDDTKRDGKVCPTEELQKQMTSNLTELGKLGVKTTALVVKTKKREAPIEEANIAGQQEYEQAYAKLVADGVTSTNVWITLGAVAFNSAEVLAAELERVRILEVGRQKTAYANQQKFLALQSDAKKIFATLPKPKKGKPLDFSGLKAGDALVLVRYVYKADGREGVSKQPTAKQASVDFLNELEDGALKTLLVEPPLLEDVPLLAAPSAAPGEDAPDEQPFHIAFGKVDVSMGALVPIAAPEWLEESLESPSDKQLNGKSILVNWGDESEPDWLVGKLSAKGEYELEGVKGNFKAKYADGSEAVHVLSADGYAESVEGEPELAWVLLGKKPPAAPAASAAPSAARQLALPAPTPQAETVEPPAPATAGRTKNGKAKAPPSAQGAPSSSSEAGPSSAAYPPSAVYADGEQPPAARGRKRSREAAAVPPPEPPRAVSMPDISSYSAAQLAELQVRIAQQLGGAL